MKWIAVLGICSLVLGTNAACADESATGPFVQASGTWFTLQGKEFPIAGTHLHYVPWGTRAEVDQAFSDAEALGFNVVRFFISSIKGSLDGNSKPTIWGWPSAPDSANMKMRDFYTVYWDDQTNGIAFNDGPNGFERIDYAIQKAAEHGLKLNIAFMDFWQYGGGSQQMRAWYGSTGGLGQTGLGAPPEGGNPDERYTFFFTDERCKADYKRLVEHVLNRRNSLTGILYKDDPTIFAWDLMNEPEMKTVEMSLAWKREMAAYVKSIDKQHLLSSGAEGFYNGSGGNDPAAELAIPDLDFGTWHTYPVYHDLQSDDVLKLIARHAGDAKKANKPVLLQEFGYGSNNPDQLAAYRKWLNAIADNKDAAGWVHWRLTGRMEDGNWPQDNGEHFDVHSDGSPAAKVLTNAARQLKKRSEGSRSK
ncbi:glycoside hydrolase 5 family protein [Planctomicrobium piriforme]|uniref:mannan endo-1,4-beta-mannosidase n=1 Tax=Planctomicrobium piriforme TaxID=1576369 RepID=A0A1I3B6U1_9PLAN|nr:cellulase family glycosylhydrolase [Planctomicrobium piriforme]SFH57930.1 mannan endo-1,4-beta-mannosidase [Planctomicrobium piriforme]